MRNEKRLRNQAGAPALTDGPALLDGQPQGTMERGPRQALAGLLVAAVCLLLLVPDCRAATTCLRFLGVSTIPRIGALGEASVAVSDATWAEANPAALASTDGSLFTFSHTAWFDDISLETLALATSTGRQGFGLSVVGLHTEPLEKYDQEDHYLGTFRFFDVFVGASYARTVLPWLRLGATGKTLYEKIDWDSATGFAVDLGLACVPARTLLAGKAAAGFVMRNLGPRMGYFREEYDLPLTWQAGFSYRPLWLPASFTAVAAVDWRATSDESGLLAGLELGLKDILFLRAGYRGPYDNGRATLGAGFRIASTLVDYAYLDMGESLGGTHRVGLSIRTAPVFASPEASR